MSGSRVLPPRWPPQCSCVVIESSFDPGERLQAPGSLWSSLTIVRPEKNGTFYHFKTRWSWLSWSIYKTGAIPGKSLKIKVTPEETRERKKQYEKDRERKFIDSWKQDRPWLHHNVEQNVIVCNWCIKANGPKSYIYIFFCNSKFWFLIILLFSGSIELLLYSIFVTYTMYKDSFV